MCGEINLEAIGALVMLGGPPNSPGSGTAINS